jgi:hypothetical protein
MSYDPINIGAAPDDDTGDTLRVAGGKINAGFSDAENRLGALETAATTLDGRLDNLDADLDTALGNTPGGFAIRSASGWGNSAEADNGGTGALYVEDSPTQYVISFDNVGTQFAGDQIIKSPFDLRWEYTGPAPTPEEIAFIGPSFHTEVTPSTDVDNHASMYCGVSATVSSDSDTVLGWLVGGRFSAYRLHRTGAAGSTNPVCAVMGTASMGNPGGSGVVGDGAIGGLFTVFTNRYSSGNEFDPIDTAGGVSGVIGRVYINQDVVANIASKTVVGVAGCIKVEAITANAIALWAENKIEADTVNNIGLNVKDMQEATNLTMAIRTGDGVVQFKDNLTLGDGINGRVHIRAVAAPTITSVQSGCLGQYLCTGGGSKTYTYKVVAVLADGITSEASNAMSTTTGFDDLSVDEHNNLVTWTPVEGAVGGYRVYRTVAGGSVTNTTGLIGTAAQDTYPFLLNAPLTPTTPSFIDDGAAGDSATPPPNNTTGFLLIEAAAATGAGNNAFDYINVKKGGTSKFRVYDDAVPSATMALGDMDIFTAGGTILNIMPTNTIVSGRLLCIGMATFAYQGETERTIASGVISASCSFHTVDTEGDAASDDLDTINPSLSVAGEFLVLRAINSARTVVVKNGTGNLLLNGDMSLDNEADTITLFFSGALNKWLEIARSSNGA